MAVLNLRVMDLSNVEQGKKITNLSSRKDDEGIALPHELPKVSNEQRLEESTGAIWGTSTPLGLSKVSIATCCLNNEPQHLLLILLLNCPIVPFFCFLLWF